MKIKYMQGFRRWIWQHPQGGNAERSIDFNFMGSYIQLPNGSWKHGFFKMYHGIKENIAGYLPSILKIAEDGQAIYEFLQNAVDCNATHFYIFYNDNFLVVINNGDPFNVDDVKGILNIGQGTKLNHDCNKIGRFGIGFKLVHRLVGKNEGIDELVNQNKGPILFSWFRDFQLFDLLLGSNLQTAFYDTKNFDPDTYWKLPHPWLLKILITNFPAGVGEIVKDLQYNEKVVFEQQELDDMVGFLKASFEIHPDLQNPEKLKNILKQGSMFFLRLGEGKREMLDKDYENLKKGVQYSMNTLKRLQKVYINEEEIGKQPLELFEFAIGRNTPEFAEIDPEYKDCDIKVAFGYYSDYKQSYKLKVSPNFYKYFPMGDENNGFSFIIHCDSFSNEANRRKLQADDVNKKLFPVIAQRLIERIENLKRTDRNGFLRLYANLLLSDIPDKQNNDWLKPIFFDKILDYLQTNIPTINGVCNQNDNVKINGVKFDIDLNDFGIDTTQWFVWDNDKDSDLVREAKIKDKLGIKTWDFADVLRNCNTEKANNFLLNTYNGDEKLWNEIIQAINEISENDWKKESHALFKQFSKLILFPTIQEGNNYLFSLEYCISNNILIVDVKHAEIISVLSKIGFFVSSQTVSAELSPIGAVICQTLPYLNDESKLFQKIADKCVSGANQLATKEKTELFIELSKLKGIGEISLKSLELFCNTEGVVKPLKELILFNQNVPLWLEANKIKSDEYSEFLKKYLLQEKEIYKNLILPNWSSIIMNISNVVDFYSKVKYYFDLEEGNTPLSKQAFIHTKDGFKKFNEVFYNPEVSKIQNYQHIQTAIESLLNCPIPTKSILTYLKDVPFKAEIWKFADWELVEGIELSLDEIKAVLTFTTLNNEFFFERCLLESSEAGYLISKKSKNTYQFHTNKKQILDFIESYLSANLKHLPSELNDFREQKGILKGDDLHVQLLEEVEVDDYLEELIDIVEYSAKSKLFSKISTIPFNVSGQYDRNSLQFKLLDLACRELQSVNQQESFRKKIRIETGDATFELSEIPTSNDEVFFENGKHKLSLAKILPNSFQNSDYLTNVIRHFSEIGIQRQQLETLFGISKELDFNHILSLFESKIENVEQLAFLILYHNNITEIDFSKFKVKAHDEQYYSLNYNYSIKPFPFIRADEILHSQYNGILDRLKEEFIIQIGTNQIYKEPYFIDDATFFYPSLATEWTDEIRVSLVDFLFSKWKKNKKTAIQKIDWTSISDKSTIEILLFNPCLSVYPSEFAIETEKLPKYLIDWIEEVDADEKLKFLYDFGVSIETSVIVKLRQYLKVGGEFTKSQIRKDADEVLVFNTFEWLKINEIVISNDEGYKIFVEMVEFINEERKERKAGDLIIETKFDFEKLGIEAQEWEETFYESWKGRTENKYCIYLYSGKLPKMLMLDEISDYIFRKFDAEDIVIEGASIYVNSHKDIQKLLYTLVGEGQMSSDDLLELYQTKNEIGSSNEVEELKNEVSRLRSIIENLTRVSGTASYSPTVSHDDYHDEIKEKSEKILYLYLQKEYPNKVIWLNSDEDGNFSESWSNHDFQLLDERGNVLNFIDCKGTPANKKTIYLTQNEWSFFLEHTDNYQIYRVFNIEGTPSILKIDNLLEWILSGRIVPYLLATEQIKGGRVFLTLTD